MWVWVQPCWAMLHDCLTQNLTGSEQSGWVFSSSEHVKEEILSPGRLEFTQNYRNHFFFLSEISNKKVTLCHCIQILCSPHAMFWCELLSFGDIGWRDVCPLSDIMRLKYKQQCLFTRWSTDCCERFHLRTIFFLPWTLRRTPLMFTSPAVKSTVYGWKKSSSYMKRLVARFTDYYLIIYYQFLQLTTRWINNAARKRKNGPILCERKVQKMTSNDGRTFKAQHLSKTKSLTCKVEDESRLKCCITPLNHERETSTSCVSLLPSTKLPFF